MADAEDMMCWMEVDAVTRSHTDLRDMAHDISDITWDDV